MKRDKRFTGCLLLLNMALQVTAQQTSSGINGMVRAASGEKLSGAVVRIVYEPAGTVWFTQTNRQGLYHFNNLQPGGPYNIDVSFIGFSPETRAGLQVLLGEPLQVDVVLQPTTKSLQEIIITVPKKKPVSQHGQLVIDKERLALLTADGKNISDYLFYLPQARMIANNEGAVSFAGQNNRYNAFFIDGATNNDVFGLAAAGTNGGQAGISPISAEAIEQLQVTRTAYNASIGNFTGAGINAVTRSGTNRKEISVYHHFNTTPGASPQQRLTGEYYDNVYGLRMQGPVKKNRCFYFLNGELIRQQYPKTFNPLTYSGALTTDEIMILINSLRANYRYDAGGFLDNPELTSAARLVGRIDCILKPGNSFAISVRFMDAAKIFSNQSAPSVIHLSNDAFSVQTRSLSLSLDWRKKWLATISNKLSLTFTGVRDDRGPVGKPFPRVRVYDADASIVFGTDNSSTINLLEQKNWNMVEQLSWSAGQHFFEIGIDAEYNRLRNAFIQNSFGNYAYASLGDFLSNSNPSGYQLGFSLIDSVQNDQVQAAAKFNVLRSGIFLNDEIRLSSRWQVGLGFRFDKHIFPAHPVGDDSIADSVLPVLAGYYDLKEVRTGQPIVIVPDLSPRFSFHCAVSSQFSLQGGIGIFAGRIPLAWPGGVYQFNGTLTSGYTATGSVLNKIRFRQDPYHQWQPGAIGATLNKEPVNLITASFRMPSLLRASIRIENNFVNGWKLMAEALYSKNLASVSYTNINLLPPADHAAGPDNRLVYTAVNNGKIPLRNNGGNLYDYIILLGNRTGNCGYAWEISSSLRKLVAKETVVEISHHYGNSIVFTDGTSSINSSQWRTAESVNGRNNLQLSTSDFSAGHKISAWFSTALKSGKTKLNVAVSYTGQSGSPFSYVYQNSITRDDGKNSSYDLVYIPTSSELSSMQFLPNLVRGVLFSPQQQKEALEEYIRSSPYLSGHRGDYAARNADRTPFFHVLNVKAVAGRKLVLGKKHYQLQVSAELQNLLNAFNQKWGQQPVIPNDQLPLIGFAGFKSNTDLTPQYVFDPGQLALQPWKKSESSQAAYQSYWVCRTAVRLTW